MCFSVECAFPHLRKRGATSRKSAFCADGLTEKRSLHQRRHLDVTERRTLRVRLDQRARSACERWLRREVVFADLCTLLRTHGRSRDRAGPRVPRRRRPHGPRDARALGPEAHAAGAVTQPPTHTSSRSLILFAHLPVLVPLDASEWQADRKRALRGFVWVDTSAKMPTWQRRHSRRARLPDQARGRHRHAMAVEALVPPGAARVAYSYRDSRRNSVHKCPKAAPRGYFSQSVYTPASPRSLARSSRGATVYTNASKRRGEARSSHLCTLLRSQGHPQPKPTAQQCTQMPRNGAERPFWPICVHSCVVALAVRPTSPVR